MWKIKKLLMMMALLPLMALADTEVVDGITWTYTITNGEATVGNGRSCAIPSTTAGTITIPSYLGRCPVAAIGNNAFAELYDLDEVKLPDSVEIIGAGAFKYCTGVYAISMGSGLKWVDDAAFKGCSQLQKIAFSEGLASIGEEAFAGCWRMQSVTLPVSVQEVDSSAFTDCKDLTGVTTPTHCGTMASWFKPIYTQIRNVTIVAGESTIRDYMFAGCSALENVAFADSKDGIRTIGDSAFQDCVKLSGLTLPESLSEVGSSAFKGCTALMAIALPSGVSWIGSSVFENCSALKDVTLSRSLTSIPDRAFYGCDSLDSFTVPESVSRLGSQIVSGSSSWYSSYGTSAIYFLGDAPSYAFDVYGSARSDLMSYVVEETRGWDGRPMSRAIPQQWPTDTDEKRGISWWSPNQFDVTFDACGGMFENDGSGSYACQQITGTAYALPPYNPKREGCVFDGWWTEVSGGAHVTASMGVSLAKAHTLYAHWIVGEDVTVRFNAMGGTVMPERGVYRTGRPFGALPVPTREYWDFAGWWTEKSGGTQILPGSEVPAADVELFARWNRARYKIVFHSSCSRYSSRSEDTAEQTFTYGETVTLWANPFTSYGLTFAGWATERGGEAVYADQKVLYEITDLHDGVIDLYAVWIGDQYAIRFDSNGGYGVMPNQTCFMGVYQQLSSNLFTRAGYVFDGWSRTKTGRREYSDMKNVLDLSTVRNDTVVLYAVWKEISYCTVTFNANGGKCDETTRKVREGDAVGELPIPTRSGYVFKGWKKSGAFLTPETIISRSQEYFAYWERPPDVTVTLDFNEPWTTTYPIQTKTYRAGTKFGTISHSPGSAGSDYEFIGWFTEREGGVQVSNASEVQDGAVIYAHWRLLNQPVGVVFDPQGGQCSKTNVTGVSGKAIGTLPTYSRVGYTFDGWYTAPEGGTKITTQTKVTEDVTYYAHATPITYKVRFNPNCGTGKMADQLFVYDQEQSLAMNSFKLSSHAFVGWSTSASGKMSIKDLFWDEQSVSNLCARQGATINLYATWTRTSSIREATHKTAKKYDPEDHEYYWYEWSSTVRLERGSSHLFWMTPEAPDSSLWMNIWCEDDEDYIGPSELFEKENEDGTLTEYYLLTAEDWDGFDKVSARFSVLVEGWEEPESFTFGHCDADYDMSVKWDVWFDATGGECAERCREVAHNKAIGTLPTPTRRKYKFNGWYTAATGGTKISATTKVTGDVTYYARWVVDPSAMCEVSFDPNGGICAESSRSVKIGKSAGAFPVCGRMGYALIGWFTDPVEGDQFIESTKVMDDVRLYAHWSKVDVPYELGQLYGTSESGAPQADWRDFKAYADAMHVPVVFIGGTHDCVYCREIHESVLESGDWNLPCLMYYDYYTTIDTMATTEYLSWFRAFDWDRGIFPFAACYWNIDGRQKIETVFTLWAYDQKAKELVYVDLDRDRGQIRKDLIIDRILEVFTSQVGRATVRFSTDVGECGEERRMVRLGEPIGTLPVLQAEKYGFLGWFSEQDGGTKVSAVTEVAKNMTLYAHWMYTGKSTVAARLVDGCSEMGTVSGGKSAKGGTKVTLKATAKKGYVFAGWYGDAEGAVSVTGEWRNPSYSFTVGADDMTFYAKFIAQADDVATVSFALPDELPTGVAMTAVPVDVSGCTSLPTVKVTGLPTGLKFDAKKSEISGKPTKSGVYTVVVTVTTVGKKTAKASRTAVVRKPGEYVARVEVPEIGGVIPGKVTGVGVYQAGKKVTLKATANKGYVFNGWYVGEGLGGLEGFMSQAASYAFTMPTEDIAYEARFVTAEEDKASIAAGVNGIALSSASGQETASPLATNVMCGVYLEWPVAAKALSQPTVKVTGLPAGLKFKSNTIYGAPTAASKVDKKGKVTPSKVKVTVTTAGKSKAEYEIALTVDPLPAWAAGTFNGLSLTGGRLGSATMTVTAVGKVSGKTLVGGTNVSFTATSFDASSKTVGETQLVAKVGGKLGKTVVAGVLTVTNGVASGTLAGAELELYRDVWKDKGADPVPADVQGLYTVKLGAGERGTGYLSLAVDKKGAVKVSGKAPDGTALSATAALVPDGVGYFADLFCAPSAYKGGYVAGRLMWNAEGGVFGVSSLDWVSLNPQATADYYAGGFARDLSASGAWYSKKASLLDYYTTLDFKAENRGAEQACWESLTVSVDQTGKKFVVDQKKSTPVQDKTTKAWSYDGANDAALAFSFTQATGIWKGSFLLWFDEPKHASQKVSFEGILVQGEDLEGFGTYDVRSGYIPYDKKGKPQKVKTYKFKESLPVKFMQGDEELYGQLDEL